MRQTFLDPRPLVDAARPFHEQRLCGDAHRRFRRHLGEGPFGEREVALAPAHHLEDHLFDLEAHLALQLARRDDAKLDQDLADAPPVAAADLHVAGAL